jgi:hypothetical protein
MQNHVSKIIDKRSSMWFSNPVFLLMALICHRFLPSHFTMIQGQRNDGDKSATENRTYRSNYIVQEGRRCPSRRSPDTTETETETP